MYTEVYRIPAGIYTDYEFQQIINLYKIVFVDTGVVVKGDLIIKPNSLNVKYNKAIQPFWTLKWRKQ